VKALLVQLPHSDRFPSVFPIGIASIASALSEVGVDVEILDVFALGYSRAEVSEHLKKLRWDVIGISAFATQYPWAKWIAAEAKRWQPGTLVVMGGPLPTYNAKLILDKTKTDVCVISEGEETIKDIVQNLGNLAQVKGIYYRSDAGQIVVTDPRPYIRDLDSLPFTRYDIFPMDVYFKNMGMGGVPNVKTINLVTSRGCPYSCNFCSRTFSGARFRSVDKIVEEIGLLRDQYGIRGVTFNDELVLSGKKRAYELCEKIKPLRVYWDCQGRANIVDLDLLRAMKAAGCTTVGYGVESGSQKILDNMNKKVAVWQNELAVTNTLKAGMTPVVQMIYGYPGEDLETIRETVEFFKRVHFYPPVGKGEPHFNLLTALPGSPLYEELLTNGRVTNEEEYLIGLEHGYYVGSPLRMNFTQFSDDELLVQKSKLSSQVRANYRGYQLKHPMELVRSHVRLFSTVRVVEGYPGVARMIAGGICLLVSRGFSRIRLYISRNLSKMKDVPNLVRPA